MPQAVETTFNMVLDMKPDTLIAAMILAVLLAVAAASAYLWLRRGRSEVSGLLISLIVVGNLACLVTGAGFVQSRVSAVYNGPFFIGPQNQRGMASNGVGRPGSAWRRAHPVRRTPTSQPVRRETPTVSPG